MMILTKIKNISNYLGVKTNRKIVVFLVDDYGAFRIALYEFFK